MRGSRTEEESYVDSWENGLPRNAERFRQQHDQSCLYVHCPIVSLIHVQLDSLQQHRHLF
jgi:hypothetical protein